MSVIAAHSSRGYSWGHPNGKPLSVIIRQGVDAKIPGVVKIDTIRVIKQRIVNEVESMRDMHVNQFQLKLNGRSLDDGETIGSLGITFSTDILMCVFNVTAGIGASAAH